MTLQKNLTPIDETKYKEEDPSLHAGVKKQLLFQTLDDGRGYSSESSE